MGPSMLFSKPHFDMQGAVSQATAGSAAFECIYIHACTKAQGKLRNSALTVQTITQEWCESCSISEIAFAVTVESVLTDQHVASGWVNR